MNGQDPSNNYVTVEFEKALNASDVHPVLSARERTAHAVAIIGNNFEVAVTVYCGVGGTSVAGETWTYFAATVTSATTVTCVLPSHAEGFHSLELTRAKEQQSMSSGLQVQYAKSAYLFLFPQGRRHGKSHIYYLGSTNAAFAGHWVPVFAVAGGAFYDLVQ